MSVCPKCGKFVRGGNKHKIGSVWMHKKCKKEKKYGDRKNTKRD